MARIRAPRPSVEELLAYDLAVCAWMEEGGCGEIPFDACRDRAPRDVATAGAGRERVPRPFRLAGFDEAGRGALAGPVVVGCVAFADAWGDGPARRQLLADLDGIGDSKRLTPRTREALYERIVRRATWGVGAASATEVDRIGIVDACRLAASRANGHLAAAVDGRLFDRGLSLHPRAEHAGKALAAGKEATATGADGRSLHVAAASVLAKVTRDRWMCRLAERFEGFALDRHKGYGTASHIRAILDRGPTSIHRRTFLSGLGNPKSQSC
jgi:ribonuclease HII